MSEELTIDRIRELRAGVYSAWWKAVLNAYDCWVVDSEAGATIADILCPEDAEEANARFIAAAPEAIDFLLAKLDEMRIEIEALRSTVENKS